tara:strand:+ start:4172 stop:4567 length:396 start_codon:yes stop_codon:yes gene_type:complete
MKNNKNIMVDMSATIIHHGHIRLLKKASKFGKVIVALSNDEDIKKYKSITPEIKFKYRKEILKSIVYVDQVVKSPWLINESFLKKYKINYLVHGEDNANPIIKKKLKIFQKTKNISSNLIRRKACKNISLK